MRNDENSGAKKWLISLLMLQWAFLPCAAYEVTNNTRLQGKISAFEEKHIVTKPLLVRIAHVNGESNRFFYLLRIPIFVPDRKRKLKNLKVRVFITTAKDQPSWEVVCPDFTLLPTKTYDEVRSFLQEEAPGAPRFELVSIYPVHQFLDAQFVHTGSASYTLSPSYMGASAGSATFSSSKQMGYSAQIPRCIGTFDDDLHAAAWDFYAVKDEPIQIGLVNLYMLLSFDNLLSTEDALKNLDLRLKTILIYNNQIKNPEFEAWRTIDRVIEMDNLLATHAGEISTDEKAFLDSSAGAEAEKDPQYELILKKQK